jgi:hypothetical protein
MSNDTMSNNTMFNDEFEKNNLIKELKRLNLNQFQVMRPGSPCKKAAMQKILK